ncbi:hypothetical protein VNO80_03438 [Phaseolus coccineus]|uniref:Uncharacterized protein n=1 Tax=Phaseolus coccineus TaxID=3886 RepID=A0AAN9RNL4_PHACN
MVPRNSHSTFSHNPYLEPRNPHSTFFHKPYLEPHTPTTLQIPSYRNPSNPKQWPNALTNPHPSTTYTATPRSPNTSFLHNPYLEPHTTAPLQHPSISNTFNPNSQNPHQEAKECEELNECEHPLNAETHPHLQPTPLLNAPN